MLSPPILRLPRSVRSFTLQSVHENRIYSLLIDCDVSYPDSPPSISFLTAINLPCVNQTTGKVSQSSSLRIQRMTDESLRRWTPVNCMFYPTGSTTLRLKPFSSN